MTELQASLFNKQSSFSYHSKFTCVNEETTMKISWSITGSNNKFDASKLRIQALGDEKVEREDSQSSKRVY